MYVIKFCFGRSSSTTCENYCSLELTRTTRQPNEFAEFLTRKNLKIFSLTISGLLNFYFDCEVF